MAVKINCLQEMHLQYRIKKEDVRMNNILGDDIFEARIGQGLTQDQFAKIYNLTDPAIFKCKKGYMNTSFLDGEDTRFIK